MQKRNERDMKIGLFIVSGLIFCLVYLALFLLVSPVMAETPSPSPTITRTPKPLSTLTYYPTNTSATPAPGSNCPTLDPSGSALQIQRCMECFPDIENTIYPGYLPTSAVTSTVTVTVQPISTITPTATPTGTWYGYGKPVHVTKFLEYGSVKQLGVFPASQYCPGGSIAGIHITNSQNTMWHSTTGQHGQYWAFYSGYSYWWGVDVAAAYNLSAAKFPSQAREGHTWAQTTYGSVDFWNAPQTGGSNTTLDLIVCKNYGDPQATITPTATPTITPICKNSNKVSVLSNLDENFNVGMKDYTDTAESYFYVSNYNINEISSDYEEMLYKKYFELDIKKSGVTTVNFVRGGYGDPVFYGSQKLTFYDCSNQILGTYYTPQNAFNGNDGWAFSNPTSLCRIVLETVNDGTEKRFSSKGVNINGCDQFSCSASPSNDEFYGFEDNAPFGIHLGGWQDTKCQLLFGGAKMDDWIASIRNIFSAWWPSFPWSTFTLPNIPSLMVCFHWYDLPVIKFYDMYIPVGQILIFFLFMRIFDSGNKRRK